MAVSIVKSYDQVGRKEDISDVITNISPTATPFQTMIGSEGIHNIIHSWQEDSLISAGDNFSVEGATAPSAVQNPTVLRTGTTQIFTKTASVSGTTDSIDTYGRENELAYQQMLRSKELKRDYEYALIGKAQAMVTGDDNTARKFASYYNQVDGSAVYTVNAGSGALNTVITSQTAAALREDIITTVAQTLYQSGVDPSVLMVKPADSLKVTGFQSNGRTSFFNNEQGRKLVNVVDTYVSPFGDLKVVMNRFQLSSAALIFDPGMWKKLMLRNWQRWTLAKTGDSTQTQILGEMGLKHKNYAASGGVINLT